jgi:hypothetical protein
MADPDPSKSRAGWTVPIHRKPRRIDRTKAAIIVAYGLAMMAAIAIVLL